MFTISANIEDLVNGSERLHKTVLNLQNKLSGAGIEMAVWPKIRQRIIEFLKGNLLKINEVDVTSQEWRDVKKILTNSPVSEYPQILKSKGYGKYTTIRHVGGSWLPVIDDDHWRATGTMEDHLTNELDKGVDRINVTAEIFSANIEVDVSQLNDAYPITIDEQLMVASGGEVGLIRLTEAQEEEIYKMLIQATGDLSAELVGG